MNVIASFPAAAEAGFYRSLGWRRSLIRDRGSRVIVGEASDARIGREPQPARRTRLVHTSPHWCTIAPRIIGENRTMAGRGKSVRTSVLLPEETHSRLQDLATANDVSAAWVIRQAILRFLDEHSGQVALPLRRRAEELAKSQ